MPHKLTERAPAEGDAALRRLVDERMRGLRAAYLDALRPRAAQVEAALRRCESGGFDATDAAARADLRDVAHKLAGTGATYGFADLSEAARALDVLLKAEPDTPAAGLRDPVARLLVACRAALGLDEIRNPPTRRAVFGRRGPAQAATAAARRRPKLLVVDDDPAVRDLFSTLLSDEADVLLAVNSDDALRVMRLHRPDLVLLDDIMPGAVTGLKFLENLQASGEFAATPIVMITASDAPEHIARGARAGAAGYITKPFDARLVAAMVRDRLGLPFLGQPL